MIESQTKSCSRCLVDTPISGFNRRKASKSGFAAECKLCASARARKAHAENPARSARWKRDQYHRDPKKDNAKGRKWYLENKDKAAAGKRAYVLRKHFGIGADEYQSMLDHQGGRCANVGCSGIPVKKKTSLCVDHNHATGAVRGLLCHNCNLALGHVDDNIDSLYGLIDYLNKYDGTTHGGLVHEIYISEAN